MVSETRSTGGSDPGVGDLSTRGLGRLAACGFDHRCRVLGIWGLATMGLVVRQATLRRSAHRRRTGVTLPPRPVVGPKGP